MKIGILTFHSQLNYGGVLQCWALKKALEEMGHEVVVVDRWHYDDNRLLMRQFAKFSLLAWMKTMVRGILGCGDFGMLLRVIRTIRFVRRLGLTKTHFCNWGELGSAQKEEFKELDIIVVGSDQVWHADVWSDPRPYLLEGAPEIRAISYASSFGMNKIPEDLVDVYARGLARFSAISCRELEGVDICSSMGFPSAHVVDPTLLLEPSHWSNMAQSYKKPNVRLLVCYFMSVDLSSSLPLLKSFAIQMNCAVDVITNDSGLRPIPKSVSQIVGNFRRGVRVKLRRGYGPKEFVETMANADWVLTDSFHAVMFSAIFNTNFRFICPVTSFRLGMFARVKEFAKRCVKGRCLADGVGRALESFRLGEEVRFDQEEIDKMRNMSRAWLMGHLHPEYGIIK